MWADARLRTIYNGHWFGRWHNKIARATGDVLATIDVGHAPTHTVTNPNERSSQFEVLNLPLSADQIFRKIEDPGSPRRTRSWTATPRGSARTIRTGSG